LNQPHNTFVVDDDKPLPGGFANGLWNGRPIIPLVT
jgi:hypothetical protein